MFSTKVLIEAAHLINFTSPILERGEALYVFIRATRRSGRLQSKGTTFNSLFQDFQYWPGVEDRPRGLPLRSQVLYRVSLMACFREICRTAMCIKRKSRHALLEKKGEFYAAKCNK